MVDDLKRKKDRTLSLLIVDASACRLTIRRSCPERVDWPKVSLSQ